MRSFVCAATMVVSSVILGSPGAARADEEGDLPKIRISNPDQDLFRLAVPPAVGDGAAAAQATEIVRKDLETLGIFRLLDPASFPDELLKEGLGFSSALWSQVGAQGAVKLQLGRLSKGFVLQGRVYQSGRGEKPVLEATLDDKDLHQLVHRWVNRVVQHFTGAPGVFGSRIAFSTRRAKGSGEIATIGMDGKGFKKLTRMGSASILPAFSADGTTVAFTSFLRRNPDLWVVSSAGGRAKLVSRRAGLNTGAVWAPDGKSLALTMTFHGDAEIYRIKPNGRMIKRLTRNRSIDSSPSFSPDGKQIAFVSNRQGSPQIYLMSANGGSARRLTFKGSYNQTPGSIPTQNGVSIAFTGRDAKGRFDVFTIDVNTGDVQRITEGQGSNQDPTWSPDGRFLVYSSSRGGLWLSNPETGHEVQIYKGPARAPSWGPAPPK